MNHENLKLSLGLFFLMIGAFIFQNYVIFPIESRLFDPATVQIASIIFIPHGFKVIFATLYGRVAILPILVAQSIGIYAYTLNAEFAISFGVIAVLAVYIPVALVSYLERGGVDRDEGLSSVGITLILGRKVLVVALMSSLLNSYFASLLNGVVPQSQIWLRFLAGDMIGTAVVLALVFLLRKRIQKFLVKRTGLELSRQL